MSAKRIAQLMIVFFISAMAAESQIVQRVHVKHLVSPLGYPPLARQARLQGTLKATLRIGNDGMVREVVVTTDDAALLAHPVLQDEIQRTVRQWTFECTGCAPGEFKHSIRFTYRLVGDDSYEHGDSVTIDLPDEVTVTDTPPMCDHCPTRISKRP